MHARVQQVPRVGDVIVKHEGVSAVRCKREPPEAKFAEAWRTENARLLARPLLEYLLRDAAFTERDATVAATVVQWLGSPVGLGFLGEVFTSHPEIFGVYVKMWHKRCEEGAKRG